MVTRLGSGDSRLGSIAGRALRHPLMRYAFTNLQSPFPNPGSSSMRIISFNWDGATVSGQ
ncbi:hypothetical protein XocBAI15_19230 [Xanthomonas oryzae pv. oryzicola]|nr:hypothetical protein XocBAI15_19230 [Xanthomonas oryzae pv. oryzicola]